MFLKPGGYSVWDDPVTGKKERDTFTCCHCNRIVIVKPFQNPDEMGGFCRNCMNLMCKTCVDKATCTPFEKKLDLWESRSRLRQQVEDLAVG